MTNMIAQNSDSLVSKDVISLFGRQEKGIRSINGMSIKLAGPEDILSWSYGEVKNGETISYRTYKPEKDGLLCAKIFGPTRDYECQCGKYRRIKYKGITCEKCGVEVTVSKVRRERLGHIDLACPVVHVLFLRGTNSVISTTLGMTLKDVERILYYDAHAVVDAGNTTMNKKQVLTDEQYEEALNEFGDSFEVMSGADCIMRMLSDIDLDKEIDFLHNQISTIKSDIKRRSLLKRVRVLSDFQKSGNKLEWMVLTRIPVLPPDLRPLVFLDGGRFASSDLNELYRSIINRNERLKRMIDSKAPNIIIKNEKRMLQEAVDALFDNSKKMVTAKSSSDRALKSISESLRGKNGRFRQNLLGKRVDYSGRSVIVVGPSLKLHQCGLPKKMALELFKPFIFSKLIMYGRVSSIKVAKMMVKAELPEVWNILDEVVREHVVLLNRAPTLHRLGIQAFEPKLIESKAIQLHPLVCKAFNADFDGDQMAVHIPLSIEAQIEARVLMMSSNNILSPQNGQPMIVPTKDMVLGLYYATSPMDDAIGNGKAFGSYNEVMRALEAKIIAINSKIKYYYSYETSPDKTHCVETTPGSVILFNLVPQDGLMSFEDMNLIFNSKNISIVLNSVYKTYGTKMAVMFADKMMNIGFEQSTKSGLSFGKDDMIVPFSKWTHIEKTFDKIKEIEQQYSAGYITQREKYNQVTDYWSECTDLVSKDMMKELAKNTTDSRVNSMYVMMNSGGRVSEALMKQVSGMRGLIAKPSGEIIETPIISNFKEGLSVLEYFNSSHGARKGAADTALRTADAGYLTRRLVDIAQDCVVIENDCGTIAGISYSVKIENGVQHEGINDVAFGRVLSVDAFNRAGEVVLNAGVLLGAKEIEKLEKSGVTEVKLRSVVTCGTDRGVCAKCYGYDLAIGHLVNIGEPIGIVAAQSIGEPGAQLTMRTFHIGGATSKTVEKSSILAIIDGKIDFVDTKVVTDKNGDDIIVSNNAYIVLYDKDGIEFSRDFIPYASKINFKNGANVKKGDKVAEWDPYNSYIISEHTGKVKFYDMVAGVTYKEKTEDSLGSSQKIIVKWGAAIKSLNPHIELCDNNDKPVTFSHSGKNVRYLLPTNSMITLKDGDSIQPGDKIVRIPREGTGVLKDITGGLPRVEDIFEARVPKQPAIVAEMDGIVEFLNEYRAKNRITIKSLDDSDISVQYSIPKGHYIQVQDGSFVKKGDIIVDGDLDPHDILSVSGVEGLTKYIVNEVQQVYQLQGVKIDNKHIEIIVKYMLQKVEIIDAGDAEFNNGQQIDLNIAKDINFELLASGKKPIIYETRLQGITRAAIQTESFISAASFQETTKVLTDAAVSGKFDHLRGMKENIIVGRLIPAGTGYVMAKIKANARLGKEVDIKNIATDI